jgi:hypothetical protein
MLDKICLFTVHLLFWLFNKNKGRGGIMTTNAFGKKYEKSEEKRRRKKVHYLTMLVGDYKKEEFKTAFNKITSIFPPLHLCLIAYIFHLFTYIKERVLATIRMEPKFYLPRCWEVGKKLNSAKKVSLEILLNCRYFS